MTVLFASDVHLSMQRPQAMEGFLRFLAHAAGCEGLYLLGDVFDLWLGDDDDTPPHPEISAALATLTATGTPVYVMHGNHDFLLGPAFEAATGCRLLPEGSVIDVHGTPVLLMHGDSLCTDDVDYQAWRSYSRDPRTREAFLALPLPARIARAAQIRQASHAQTQLKPEAIMDVNPQAVMRAMGAAGVQILVHGHTHRPGVHPLTLDGRQARRIVLGDWYQGDTVLVWDTEGYRLVAAGSLA